MKVEITIRSYIDDDKSGPLMQQLAAIFGEAQSPGQCSKSNKMKFNQTIDITAAEPEEIVDEAIKKPKRTRRSKKKEESPAVEQNSAITLESLRALATAKAKDSAELRSKVVAVIREYAANGRLDSVEESDYAVLETKLQKVGGE